MLRNLNLLKLTIIFLLVNLAPKGNINFGSVFCNPCVFSLMKVWCLGRGGVQCHGQPHRRAEGASAERSHRLQGEEPSAGLP